MKREDWARRRSAWAHVLSLAGSEMRGTTPLYKILGSVAWGRYDGEPQPGELKDNIIFGCGYLQGVRDAALHAGRELSLKGTTHLEGIHERVRKRLAGTS